MPEQRQRPSGVTYNDFNRSQAQGRVSNRRSRIEENKAYEERRRTAERFGSQGQRPGEERGGYVSNGYAHGDDDVHSRYSRSSYGNPGRSGDRPSDRRSSSGSNNSSHPSKPKKKKRHGFLKFLGVLVLILAVAAAGFAISQNMKGDDQWRSEYTGTWQVKAIGNVTHPVMSIGASVILGNSSDLTTNMTLGVADNLESQLTTFGLKKNYTFLYDKSHFTMTSFDGTDGVEGDLHFGYLFVKDATGTLVVYEKVSEIYEMDYSDGQVDAAALLDVAEKAAASAGDAGQSAIQVLEGVDVNQLQEYLNGMDPQELQEVIGQMDASTLQEIIDGVQAQGTE